MRTCVICHQEAAVNNCRGVPGRPHAVRAYPPAECVEALREHCLALVERGKTVEFYHPQKGRCLAELMYPRGYVREVGYEERWRVHDAHGDFKAWLAEVQDIVKEATMFPDNEPRTK